MIFLSNMDFNNRFSMVIFFILRGLYLQEQLP